MQVDQEVMILTPFLNKNLIEKNDRIVIAVSGGIDSMVLLDALCALKDSYHLDLTVCHVNHKKRKESDEEYQFVQSRCLDYGVRFEGMILSPAGKENFHQYAREERYEFFYQTAKKVQANKIALAHHADDQSETILMRLVRGSGFIGYAGISAQGTYKDLPIIRPLLLVTRKEIIAYQTAHELDYRNDSSNFEDHYTRNRYRHHLMPLIQKEDPKYSQKFAQFSTYITEAYQLIDRLTKEFLKEKAVFTEKEAMLPIRDFLSLDRAVARNVVKKTVDRLTEDSLELSFRHLNSILLLAESSKPNASLSIHKSLLVHREYENICFSIPVPEREFESMTFAGLGSFTLNNGDNVTMQENASVPGGISIELWYNNLDLVFPLCLRRRKTGDRIKLAHGTKKVSDLLIDLKVPRKDREEVLVLENRNKEILWVLGYKIGVLTKEGKQKIHISYQKGSTLC